MRKIITKDNRKKKRKEIAWILMDYFQWIINNFQLATQSIDKDEEEEEDNITIN